VTVDADGWNRIGIFIDSLSDAELSDRGIPDRDLALRLFHEEGVISYPDLEYRMKCRCSVEKVEAALHTLSAQDFEELAEEGSLSVGCEFCGRKFEFDPEEMKNRMISFRRH
jgi:molecular chaperone Hsp33